MFLHRVIPFEENLGDKVRVRSPKKLKILIEVPTKVHVSVRFISLHMVQIFSLWPFFTTGYPLGDKVRVRCPKKLKIFIEVP